MDSSPGKAVERFSVQWGVQVHIFIMAFKHVCMHLYAHRLCISWWCVAKVHFGKCSIAAPEECQQGGLCFQVYSFCILFSPFNPAPYTLYSLPSSAFLSAKQPFTVSLCSSQFLFSTYTHAQTHTYIHIYTPWGMNKGRSDHSHCSLVPWKTQRQREEEWECERERERRSNAALKPSPPCLSTQSGADGNSHTNTLPSQLHAQSHTPLLPPLPPPLPPPSHTVTAARHSGK